MKLYDKEHLTDRALSAHVSGALSKEETLEIALHTADCPRCLDRLTALLEKREPLAPAGTAELIMLGVSRLEEKRKREFSLYCVRVAACACAAIAVLISGVFMDIPDLITTPKKTEIPVPVVQTVPAPESETTLWESFASLAKKATDTIFNKSEADND